MGNTWNMSEYYDAKDRKDGTTVTVLPIRTESAKSLVEAAHRQSLQKRKTGCRELVESNSSLPKATPSIHLHCSTCTCAPPSPLDTSADDETLARRIQAASAVCRAKTLSSPGSSPKLASFAAFQSVSRWLTGATPAAAASVSDLCAAVSALDITKTTRLLFDDSAPINDRNPAGVPPLISAIRSPMHKTHPLSHLAMLSLLLDAGADPNTTTSSSPLSGCMSALSAASSLGHTPLVRLLLDRGAAADAKLTTVPMSRFSGHGLTALHVAVFADRPEVADLLLSHGGASAAATFEGYRAVGTPESKPAASSPRRHGRVWTTGIAALHLADDSPACTALLLRRGADPDARDGFGRTALHWAMGGGNVGVVHLLLEAGTAVDVLDDDGATPLAVLVARLESGASRAGHPDVVKMLLAAGANPDLRYPQDLSVKSRLLLMEEWRGVYEGVFERYALGSGRVG
ncbi:ankyrin [Coniochaeta ligniaria NRRL 30616]|uniref:Ankyrin n=1 Tax=Coniochaeta ligniaria NRRL 30616 TaxID=1408157 RepID=A0A1J7IA82_9PEZI|nr:ankyrin [Coniochaeta ligniaria NRRL 30616]